MQTVKIGLIGAGSMARKHLEVIKAIEWIQPVGITSRTKTKAEQLASEFNFTAFDDSETLIKCSHPDGLMVLVSEDQKSQVVESLIPYRLPLFIEKPAGLSPQENLKLAQCAKEYSVSTMVGFNRRFYSIFHAGLEVIKQHGPLMGITVEGHERMWKVREGKRFSDEILSQWIFANSVHTIDLLRFFGGEPTNVISLAHRYFESRGDQFSALIEFQEGSLGIYNAHWYSPGGWRVVLYGNGVTVEFRPLEKGWWIDKNFKCHDIVPDEVDIQFKPGFFRQMEAFGTLIREQRLANFALDLEGSYRTMLLAQKISSNVLDKSPKESKI